MARITEKEAREASDCMLAAEQTSEIYVSAFLALEQESRALVVRQAELPAVAAIVRRAQRILLRNEAGGISQYIHKAIETQVARDAVQLSNVPACHRSDGSWRC
jgi:hypothetical protein